MTALWALSVSAVVTYASMPLVIRLLQVVNVIDIPNARSSHVKSTLRGGGISVMSGVLAGVAVGATSRTLWLVVALAAAAAAIGLVDDLRTLPATLRLVAQSLLAVMLVTLVLHIETSVASFGLAAVAVVGVVGYTNAFNFMDGINGISAVSGALAGSWFLYVGTNESLPSLAVGGAVLLGACLGFVPWNFPRARVFLGDVGSYGLGMLIAALALTAFAEGISLLTAAAPLLVYGADTAWTLIRRLLRGDSWREAHREHAYQRLCDVGLSHSASTAVVGLQTALVCGAVLVLPTIAATAAASAILVSYLCLPRVLVSRDHSGFAVRER